MTLTTRFQPFRGNDAQPLVEREVGADWSRMMIGSFASPILLDHGQIEVPIGDLTLTFRKNLLGTRRERDRPQTRRAA